MAKRTPPSPDQVRAKADLAEQRNRLALEELKARSIRRAAAAANDLERSAGRPRSGRGDGPAGEAWALSGSYRSSRTDRTRKPFGGASGTGAARVVAASPDAHADEASLDAMRRDSQDAYRNSELAQVIITRKADLSVGDGSSAVPESSSEEFNDAVRALWEPWYDSEIDCRGMLGGPEFEKAVEVQADVDGDLGILLRSDGRLQVIDAVRVGSAQGNRSQPGGDNWTSGNGADVAGVLLDRDGRLRGLRVWEYGPGGAGIRNSTNTARVLPAESVLWLVNPRGRSGGVNQTRGVPLLSPVIDRIAQLDGYIQATQVAARVAACLTFITKSANPASLQSAMEGATTQVTNADGTTSESRTFVPSPGGVLHLGSNEIAEGFNPAQPNTQFDQFVTACLQVICAHAGLPLLLALFDPSGVNLSTLRGMVLATGLAIRTQQDWRVRRFLNPVYRWRVAMWVRQGKLPSPPADWDRCSWILEPLPVLDPEAEIRAAKMGIDARLDTYESATLRLWGKRAEPLHEQISKEVKRLDALGIAPLTTPGQQVADAAARGAGPATPPDPANPPEN